MRQMHESVRWGLAVAAAIGLGLWLLVPVGTGSGLTGALLWLLPPTAAEAVLTVTLTVTGVRRATREPPAPGRDRAGLETWPRMPADPMGRAHAAAGVIVLVVGAVVVVGIVGVVAASLTAQTAGRDGPSAADADRADPPVLP